MNKPHEILLKFRPLAALLLALAIAPATARAEDAQSGEIIVKGKPDAAQGAIEAKRLKSSDTATLLEDAAGVNVQSAGGVSGLPVINGLADDRLLVYVDNMIVCSACANHMNPPLSYMPSSSVGNIYVNTGVIPVSEGGDSIGGSIRVESQPPLYAVDDQLRAEGVVSSCYRSNNRAAGASFGATVASRNLSLGVTGSIDHADDYRDGHGNKITSTYYEARNFGLTLGARSENHRMTLKAGHQYIPGQGFVNQWMDMLANNSTFVNLGYHGSFDWGVIDATGYWQNTWHKMDSGDDKLPINLAPPPTMPYMPMITRGVSVGYTLKTEINLTDDDILRIGNEFHRFSLNDYWPPVEGYPSMWPETFLNINHGHRDRYAFFAEWEGSVSSTMTAILGVRNEQVRMDTGDVQGYNDQNSFTTTSGTTTTNYLQDSTTFNAADHAKSDSNWDFSAILKYEPDAVSAYELGYSRKTRSPNLYERYAWSRFWMASGMLGWFGDGNGYVGNLDLRPEVAHTFSLTGTWRDADRNRWQLKITPYFTHIHDYIGVKKVGEKIFTNETRNILQFTNHNAELYGIDISGQVALWGSEGFGKGRLYGTIGYVHGINVENGESLYHMMPLNARVALEQKLSAFTNTLEMQLVSTKSETDPLRFEPQTSGYVLVNLGSSYEYKNLRIDVGVTNLFDKFYYLPLGGINYDDFLASKKSTEFEPLAGAGRSFNIGFTQKF
ncbi:TonB-dependent receptor [Chlorobaculum sp. 24CR]|uniref:TonB-dependent receptor n=1 Tax=Chlorobaculum sp. 24CR TaxID=2508878 RepID=UPI00100BF95B|nr:TonB-dependent receptor [Chlorobaculum sp. 24CR]RXK80672.1 TonB-dependent receptor [Chlorobaculum sp. 24CR]